MANATAKKVTANGTHSDYAESVLRTMDRATTQATGISMFHVLSLLAIGGSIGLFLSGRKLEGIFVGLWPPTFEALKAAAERNSR